MRRLTTIVAADVADYSRLVSQDEEGMVAELRRLRVAVIDPLLLRFGGRVANTAGDSLLIEFPSAVEAVRCAVAVQDEMQTSQTGQRSDRQFRFRIGINVGDVIAEEGGDLLGDGVNIAARLEALAPPGGIVISRSVHDQVRDRLELTFTDLGKVPVKNIPRPVHALQVLPEGKVSVNAPPPARKRRPWRRVAVAAVVAVTAFLGWVAFFSGVGRTLAFNASADLPLPDKPSVVVLPFRNLTGDAEEDYLSNGFTSALVANLSRFKTLFVISDSSTRSYRDNQPEIGAVARELGVRYVVTGDYLQSPVGVQVNARLSDAVRNTAIWAESYSVPRESILQLQADVTRQITTATQAALLEDAQLQAQSLADEDGLRAYDLFLRASKFTHDRAAIEEDIAQLRQAIALRPDFAEAYTLMGWRYVHQFRHNLTDDPQAALDSARAAARTSMALDDSNYLTYRLFCVIHLYGDRKHELALSECERAVELNPNDADMRISLAQVLTFMGRADEGIVQMDQARRLHPRHGPAYDWTGSFVYVLAGQYELGLVDAQRALTAFPRSLSVMRIILVALVELDRMDEARQVAGEILEIQPDFTIAMLRNAPYQHKSDEDRIYGAMIRAGIPRE